jgi:hypothetical protein
VAFLLLRYQQKAGGTWPDAGGTWSFRCIFGGRSASLLWLVAFLVLRYQQKAGGSCRQLLLLPWRHDKK